MDKKSRTNEGKFPASDYAEFRDFFKQIAKADGISIIITKN